MKNINLHLIDLLNLKSRVKNKFLDIVLVLLTIIIAYSIYKNQNSTLASLKSNIKKQIDRNEVLERIIKLEKKMDSYRQVLKVQDASELINTINNVARASGINILSIRPEIKKVLPAYEKQIFSISITAENYHLLGRFISKLESSSDFYLIEFFNIRSISKEYDSGSNRGRKELVSQEGALAAEIVLANYSVPE